MTFDDAILAAVYAGPGSVAVDAAGTVTRGFLEIETLTASDGGGLTSLRRTTLRVQAQSLAEVAVDGALTVDGLAYRIASGPNPIDDGAEMVLELVGPFA